MPEVEGVRKEIGAKSSNGLDSAASAHLVQTTINLNKTYLLPEMQLDMGNVQPKLCGLVAKSPPAKLEVGNRPWAQTGETAGPRSRSLLACNGGISFIGNQTPVQQNAV